MKTAFMICIPFTGQTSGRDTRHNKSCFFF